MAQQSERIGRLIGRVLLSIIFIGAGLSKMGDWSGTAGYMASRGMPAIPVFLTLAIVFEVLGGFSVLLGWKTKAGAAALLLFLVPVTLIFHNFWTYPEAQQQIQMAMFLKNLAIMGGLLILASAGPGSLSVDGRRGS